MCAASQSYSVQRAAARVRTPTEPSPICAVPELLSLGPETSRDTVPAKFSAHFLMLGTGEHSDGGIVGITVSEQSVFDR